MVPERALSVPNASGTYRFDNRFLESRARPAKDGIPVREFPGFGNRASQKFQAGIPGNYRRKFPAISTIQFLADRTNGRAYATVLRLSVVRL